MGYETKKRVLPKRLKKTPWQTKAKWVAIVAAVAGLLFSFFQWWAGRAGDTRGNTQIIKELDARQELEVTQRVDVELEKQRRRVELEVQEQRKILERQEQQLKALEAELEQRLSKNRHEDAKKLEENRRDLRKRQNDVKDALQKLVIFCYKDSPAEVRLGQTLFSQTVVVNFGKDVAEDIVLQETIPAGLDKCRSEEVSLTRVFPKIAPQEIQRLSHKWETGRAGTFTQVAAVYHKGQLLHQSPTTTKVITPELRLSQETPEWRPMWRPLADKITVSNNGDATALEAELTYFIPAQLRYLRATPKGTFRPGSGKGSEEIFWKLGDIPPQQKMEIVVDVLGTDKGVCRSIVQLRCQSPIPPYLSPVEMTNNFEIRDIATVDFFTYDTEDPVVVGKQTTYVTVLTNQGTGNMTQTEVTSRIPDSMDFIAVAGPLEFNLGSTPLNSAMRFSATGSQFHLRGNEVNFVPVQALPPRKGLIYKVACKAKTPGVNKYTVELRYREFSKLLINEESTTIYK